MLFIHGLVVGGLSFYASIKTRTALDKKKQITNAAIASTAVSTAFEVSKLALPQLVDNPVNNQAIAVPERSGDKNFPVATASIRLYYCRFYPGLNRTYKNTIMASAILTVGIVGGVFAFHLTLSATIIAYLTGMEHSVTHAMLPLAKERWLSQNKKK